MITFAEESANGLNHHEFADTGGDDSLPQKSGDDTLTDARRELAAPAAPAVALNASDYLDWLDYETLKAQRAAEMSMAGHAAVMEDLSARTMVPLSDHLPPAFRLFLERRLRAAEAKLHSARRIASAHAGFSQALARGSKTSG
ncbi:MAG: hypothetical protein ACREHV_01060 [Rhizomicrobium sp.]